jgi:hypothetical protein
VNDIASLCRSFTGFCKQWDEEAQNARGQAMHTSTLEFERIWTNRSAPYATRGQAVSVWRPVPLPGYVSLGDCMMMGSWLGPRSALVVLDEPDTSVPSGQPPLLAPPTVRFFFVSSKTFP